jgi:hypothetical protein
LIKSGRIGWAGYVTHMGDRRGTYRALVAKPEGKEHLEDIGMCWKILLKWILKH